MTFDTPSIPASVLAQSTTNVLSGKGIVEKKIDDTTFIIRTQSESFQVRVISGDLNVGDSVTLTQNDTTLLIKKIHNHHDELKDLLDLGVSQKYIEIKKILDSMVKTVSLNPEGGTTVSALKYALQTLDKLETLEISIADALAQLKKIHISMKPLIQSVIDPGLIAKLDTLIHAITRDIPVNMSGEKGKSYLSPPQVITLSHIPGQSIWYVENGAEALRIFQNYSESVHPTIVKSLQNSFETPLLIRFFQTLDGTSRAVLIPFEQAPVALENLLRLDMKCEKMATLDPMFLANHIVEKKKIDMPLLTAIDHGLSTVLEKKTSLSLSEKALYVSLSQFLSVAIEIGESRLPEFQNVLTRTSLLIPHLLSGILSHLQKTETNNVGIYLKKFLTSELCSSEAESKLNILPALCRNIGFSLENDLLISNNQVSHFSQEKMTNLKSNLLILLAQLEKNFGTNIIQHQLVPELSNLDTDEVKGIKVKEPDQRYKPEQPIISETQSLSMLSKSPLGTLYQQIDLAIKYIESLQMLAKPISTNEGEQQVIVLPVNIKGEWTELRIKLLRNKQSKNKKNNVPTITLTLNMTISHCGEITSQLQYIQKKSLYVTFECSTDSTREWFEKNKKDFVNILTGMGFPLVRIQCDKEKTTDNHKINKRSIHGKNSTFDILG